MIYIIFPLCTALYFYCRSRRKRSEAKNAKARFQYWLARSGEETLKPVVFVTVGLALLDMVIAASSTDAATLRQLYAIDRHLADFNALLKHCKLTPFWSFLVLLSLFALNLSWQRARARAGAVTTINRVYGWYTAYHKRIGVVANVFGFLSAFTLFGPIVAEQGRVKLAVRRTSDEYQHFRENVKQALAEETAHVVSLRIVAIRPVAADAVQRITKAEESEKEILLKMAQEKLELASSAPSAKEPSEVQRTRQGVLEKIERQLQGQKEETAVPPDSVSRARIRQASSRLSAFTAKMRSSVVAANETGYVERLIKSGIKMCLQPLGIAKLNELGGEIPLFKPVISIFTDTLTNRLTQSLNQKIEQITIESTEKDESKVVNDLTEVAKQIGGGLRDEDIAPFLPWIDACAIARRELEQTEKAGEELRATFLQIKLRNKAKLASALRAGWTELLRTNADRIRMYQSSNASPASPLSSEHRRMLSRLKLGQSPKPFDTDFGLDLKKWGVTGDEVARRKTSQTESTEYLSLLADEIIEGTTALLDIDAECRVLTKTLSIIQSSDEFDKKLALLSAQVATDLPMHHSAAQYDLNQLLAAQKAFRIEQERKFEAWRAAHPMPVELGRFSTEQRFREQSRVRVRGARRR